MKPKPRIYLDLDGVIYPTAALDLSAGAPEGVDFHDKDQWWRRDVVEELGRLSTTSVELVIASSWGPLFMEGRWASPLETLKPTRALPVALSGQKPAEVAIDLENNPAPYVWIDDDITPKWVDQVNASTPVPLSSLVIVPKKKKGLTLDELATIEHGFIDQLD